jgi:hypothetical protein|nr:MAG TPA: hypothetical protein [Caudoviricetes sp.]
MELETKLPVPDKEARRVIEDNFRKIQETLGKVQTQVDDLSKSDVNTEYITDTNVNTDHTIDAPTSVMVNDGGNGDELSGLTIEEQKGEN